MKTSPALVAALALASLTAAAQTYTIQPPLSQTYAPLVGATTVVTSSTDDGYAIVPLGFTFPYYGVNYTTVHVNTNGFLAFGNAAVCQPAACRNNTKIPLTVRTPNIHNLVAAWWDDLVITSPGLIRQLQGPGQIEIEFSN